MLGIAISSAHSLHKMQNFNSQDKNLMGGFINFHLYIFILTSNIFFSLILFIQSCISATDLFTLSRGFVDEICSDVCLRDYILCDSLL